MRKRDQTQAEQLAVDLKAGPYKIRVNWRRHSRMPAKQQRIFYIVGSTLHMKKKLWIILVAVLAGLYITARITGVIQ